MEHTTAEKILDILEDIEITEKNYLEYFDAINLLELYENDLKGRRLNLNLKMNACRWMKYQEIFTDKTPADEIN